MNTTPGRSAIGISFHPKPQHAITLPCQVTAKGHVIGDLVSYDARTGHGTAELENHVSAALLPFLEIAGYTYIDLRVEPDMDHHNAMPDFRQVELLIDTCPTRDTIDAKGLVDYVLSRMNPPAGGKREAIIARVRQWHVIQHSP